MTTSKSKTCQWIALANSASILAVLTAFPPPLVGAEAQPVAFTMSEEEIAAEADNVSYLEVILNAVPTHRMARFIMMGGRIFVDAETLRSFGLRWPGSESANGLIALDDLPGLQFEYLVQQQQIALFAPIEMLTDAVRRSGFAQPAPAVIDPLTRVTGFALNYDAFALGNADNRSLSGWSEMRLFGRKGVISNSMVTRYTDSDATQSRSGNVRLDTNWQLDFPDRMLSLSAGDSVTGGLSWTRLTRVGGVRLARNFALQPYRIFTPLVSFTGESTLPSTVDLFINGIRQSSTQVLPGQFQIDTAPMMNGAGQAQVAITDINGRVQFINFSLYGSPVLLQDGMSDWSVELGQVREDYGVKSFSYRDDPMLSLTGRYGLSNQTTLEAHVEASDGLAMAGAGGSWLLGKSGGVLSLAAAGSQYDSLRGGLARAAYQWNSPGFNAGLTSMVRERDFRDVASLAPGSGVFSRRTDQGYVGFSSVVGYFSINLIRQTRNDDSRARLVNLNWSKQLPYDIMLSVNAFRDMERDEEYGVYVHLSIPLDRYTRSSVVARRARGNQNLALEARRMVQTDLGGWGWRAQATAGDAAGGQAEATWLGQSGQWTAGINRQEGVGRTTAYANASGSLVLMGKHLRAMRNVDDSFAMVSTDGVAGVPVMLENRLVGHTDEDGILLLNRLNAWQRNLVSIDTLPLPPDMYVSRTRTEAVPATRSGTLVTFPMRRILSVRLVLVDANGALVPVGSAVRVSGAELPPGATRETVVGFDGMVYLQDPMDGATLQVRMATSECQATLPALGGATGQRDVGEVVCR